MSKHSRDWSGKAFEIGQKAEDLFREIAIAKGCKVTEATFNQQVREGFDFVVERQGLAFNIEVKSQKRINRGDTDTQNEFIWIEFSNVRGDPGWLYKRADHIAFQHNDEFWVVPRLRLVERAEALVQNEWVTNAKDALYKMYQRKDRNDILTLITYQDIEDLKVVWK